MIGSTISNACLHCKEEGKQCCNLVCKTVYSCSIDKTLIHCGDKFNRFTWQREIAEGVGNFGVIYKVYNKERREMTILKAQVYNRSHFNNQSEQNADNEMLISCTMNGLHGYVPVYDYWICDAKPVDPVFRQSSIKKYLDNDSYKLFYIEMQQLDGTMQDIINNKTSLFNETSKLSFLFEYAWHISQGRILRGFSHGDIKPDNVFYIKETRSRNYLLIDPEDNSSVTIHINNYLIPIVADYGSSRLNSKDRDYENDIIGIEMLSNSWGLLDFEHAELQRENPSSMNILLHRIYISMLMSHQLDMMSITENKRKIKKIKSRRALIRYYNDKMNIGK